MEWVGRFLRKVKYGSSRYWDVVTPEDVALLLSSLSSLISFFLSFSLPFLVSGAGVSKSLDGVRKKVKKGTSLACHCFKVAQGKGRYYPSCACLISKHSSSNPLVK